MAARMYRIFDTAVLCEFELPELPELPVVSAGDCSVSIRMGQGDADPIDSRGFEIAFEWATPDGQVVCWCERADDEYLIVFPRSATFHITSEGSITCFLKEGSNMQMLRHLLLNQIIPRFLATSGHLLIHAGAVTLTNGKSVAFLGNSGYGKSTLVSSFHRHGAKLINDDCILLESTEDGVTAVGGLAGLRLFPDSVNAVFDEAVGFTNYTPYTDKQQLFLKSETLNDAPMAHRLDAMFLLNDPKQDPSDEVKIEAVSGGDAMMAVVFSAFSLDPSDKGLIARNFHNIGQVLGEVLGLYSLSYPREHAQLAAVRKAVSDSLSAG